jgi:hypothetical protein
VTFAEGAGPDARNYRVSCERLVERFPEYRSSWTVRAGVEQLYAEYLRCGLDEADLQSPRLLRVAHVRELLESGLLARPPFHRGCRMLEAPKGCLREHRRVLPLVRVRRPRGLPLAGEDPAGRCSCGPTPTLAEERFPSTSPSARPAAGPAAEEVPPEKLFVENYLYFSSFSDELLRHSREHAPV